MKTNIITLIGALAAFAALAQEPSPVNAGPSMRAVWDGVSTDTDGNPIRVVYDLAVFPADVIPERGRTTGAVTVVRTDTTQLPLISLGTIEDGEYRFAVRAVDDWGNVSAWHHVPVKWRGGEPMPPKGFRFVFEFPASDPEPESPAGG